ncbi:MAG: DUF1646 family protein [Elusimicrobia bacterium]|nr:DUF1646 family protein [Elusimicrobiota bacterium]
MDNYFIIAGLAVIMAFTLVLPFSVKKVEEELEAFLFVMGAAAVTISGVWSGRLVIEALKEPLPITLAVLTVGFIFKRVRHRIKDWLGRLTAKFGLPRTVFIIITFLGFASSILTAIIASLILAEVISVLELERSYEVRTVVYACYAIGLGAALTPLGEPLSTIAIAKLKGPPHNADFFYLIKQLGVWVAPGVLLTAFIAGFGVGKAASGKAGLTEDAIEDNKSIVVRAARVYLFVMALIFLGAGLKPLAERFVPGMPVWALYWANSVSAVLDNATLVAAEVTPFMSGRQVTFVLMGLLVSGGLLIPGNIPNIVCAAKLDISSGEWARAALPCGAALMLVYFVLLSVFVK